MGVTDWSNTKPTHRLPLCGFIVNDLFAWPYTAESTQHVFFCTRLRLIRHIYIFRTSGPPSTSALLPGVNSGMTPCMSLLGNATNEG